MLKIRHIQKKVKGDYRLIAISDIHGHLDRFIALLNKVHYHPDEDYLVIIGDFVEKGDQVLETIHYVMRLAKYPRCFVLAGNCEWALDAMLTIPELSKEIPTYLKRVSANGIVRSLYEKYYSDGHETQLGVQKGMAHRLHDELRFIEDLPITLKFNDFIFVHAGLEDQDDYRHGRLSSYLEMQRFLERGHHYRQTVIVGHLPTSNYDEHHINNDIIIDEKKRIISIDGGTGVKMISQLNALIIENKNHTISYTCKSVQPLPYTYAAEDVSPASQADHKIAFPRYRVEILEKGPDFTKCRQIDTGDVLMIKNEFLYRRGNQWYCLDDYTDHQVALKKGERVKLIGVYGRYGYIAKGHEVGWTNMKNLEGVNDGAKTQEENK